MSATNNIINTANIQRVEQTRCILCMERLCDMNVGLYDVSTCNNHTINGDGRFVPRGGGGSATEVLYITFLKLKS